MKSKKPATTLFEKGLHLIVDRDHYKALNKTRQWAELISYRTFVRAGACPITAAAAVIVKEFSI